MGGGRRALKGLGSRLSKGSAPIGPLAPQYFGNQLSRVRAFRGREPAEVPQVLKGTAQVYCIPMDLHALAHACHAHAPPHTASRRTPQPLTRPGRRLTAGGAGDACAGPAPSPPWSPRSDPGGRQREVGRRGGRRGEGWAVSVGQNVLTPPCPPRPDPSPPPPRPIPSALTPMIRTCSPDDANHSHRALTSWSLEKGKGGRR